MARTAATHPVIAGHAPWQRAVCEYIERLRQHYSEQLVTVVLYGSRARGDADQESDVDLLIVLRGEFDQQNEQRIASDLTDDLEDKYGYPLLGVIVATESDYRSRMLPLFMNVRREGIELWLAGEQRVSDDRSDYREAPDQDVNLIMAHAREALADAEFGLEHARYRWAVNRAYYAMFHAATALLLLRGLAFSKHRGVISAFSEQFVKSGKFGAALGGQLNKAFEARNIADYSYRDDVSEQVADRLVRSATAFVAEADRLLGS
jgi:uncharacterized protein (UPF0332 family)/predicted nucleotidyltransferase